MRTSLRYLSVSFLAIVYGCSGGGGDGPVQASDPGLQRLAECTGLSLKQLNTVTNGMLHLLRQVDSPGTPPPEVAATSVNYKPATGVFSVTFDFDKDGNPDTTVEGTVSPPVIDIATGGEFTADWVATGAFMANGSFKMRVGGDGSCSISGPAASIANDCTFDGVLNVTLFEYPAEPGVLQINGHVSFATNLGNLGPLTGTISFAPILGGVATVNGTFNDAPVIFEIDLGSFQVDFG